MKENRYFVNGIYEKKMVDDERSAQITKELNTISLRCFINSIFIQQKILPNALYVEGFGIWKDKKGTSVWCHGWLEDDGVIVDALPDIDWEKDEMIYFPAIKYTAKEVSELLGTIVVPPYFAYTGSPNYPKFNAVLAETMRIGHGTK